MKKDRRIQYLTSLAAEVFGDRKRAVEWMETESRYLHGDTPVEKSATRLGAVQVKDYLLRMEYGVYC